MMHSTERMLYSGSRQLQEIESLVRNRTWVTVKRSSVTSRPLDNNVVLKIKRNADGTVEKYKARLADKRYQQNLEEVSTHQ